MSRVFLNFASLSNLRKPVFVSWHAQHVNAATGRYKDMSSSWGKTKEAATGDLSLWKHAMRRHPIFRLVPPLEKCFHETVTWSQQGKHLESCELNKSFKKKTHEQPRNQEHVTWKWRGSMNHWPQKASCPEEKADTLALSRCYRRYQDLLEIPGSEVSENCLVSFVADNPRIWLRLSIQYSFGLLEGITAGHCAGSGKKVCNLDFEESVSWFKFIVRFLSSFGIPDLSW